MDKWETGRCLLHGAMLGKRLNATMAFDSPVPWRLKISVLLALVLFYRPYSTFDTGL